jgi:flagellar biosynthesis/type III secretory pathway M-ring protein FliF/YscJ
MDFIKSQLTRLQQQLGSLTATQKMLTASLLTIMVMTLMWWSHWAAEPDMTPLIDQTMSDQDISQIASNLEAQNIPHRVESGKIYVPTDRKIEILGELGYSQSLPHNFGSAFDDVVKQVNPFDSPDKTDRMFNHAKELGLADIIRSFPGVRDAGVVINAATETTLDGPPVQPGATVTILTAQGLGAPNSRQLAESAGNTVCPCVPGLMLGHISVIVDGKPFPLKDKTEDDMSGDDAVSMQKQYEDSYRNKILQQLANIRDVLVSVTVQVDMSRKVSNVHKIDPKQTVSVATHTESTSDETTGEAQPAQDPGVTPNTGMSLASGGGSGGAGSTNTSDISSYETDHAQENDWITTNPGVHQVQAVSVRVPRTYFINAYKAENGGKEPDDASLAKYEADEIVQIHDQVKGCCAPISDDVVFVSSYADIPQTEAPPMEMAGAGAQVSGALTAHTKDIGIGALAAVSLFMVMMMVRKATPEPLVIPEAIQESGDPQPLDGGETVVGQASGGGPALDAVELDPDAAKSQQMLDQLESMVHSNPDAAATLVKRWLNR